MEINGIIWKMSCFSWNQWEKKDLPMVVSQQHVMGNGSMKTPRPEGSCLKAPPLWETVEPLRGRIVHLEEELSNRERELRARDEQLRALQAELEARLAQVHKLQDALGNQALGSSPSTQPHSSHRLLSVINQGPARFQHVAVEVHRRLRAKEGVSAEPTSGHYCAEAQVQACTLQRVCKNSRWGTSLTPRVLPLFRTFQVSIFQVSLLLPFIRLTIISHETLRCLWPFCFLLNLFQAQENTGLCRDSSSQEMLYESSH